MNSTFGSRQGNRLGVLTYHRLAATPPGAPPPPHNVAPEVFRAQVTGLLERGFHFVTLSRALAVHADGGALPPRAVVVTFDDGFASVYHGAFPVLRQLGIPATIFVCTEYIDQRRPFSFDPWGIAYRGQVSEDTYLPLTQTQYEAMCASGLVELGVHTHTHADRRGCPAAFETDVRRSVLEVRRRFGYDHPTFAFPFGSRRHGFCDESLTTAARRAGVRCALTQEPKLNDLRDDPFGWGRFNVFAWDTSATLAGKLGGWYGWVARLRDSLVPSPRRPPVGGAAALPVVDEEASEILRS